MPWELVADFRATPELSAADQRWGTIATALVKRMLEQEPRLRVILRNLPAPNVPKHSVARLQRSEVNTAFATRLEVPEGREYLVRQYFCKTCGTEEKPKWFPQMYLSGHKGHNIQSSPPTGRALRHGWNPNFRMFFGRPERLSGTTPGLPSAAITTMPKTWEGFERFDWVLAVPTPQESWPAGFKEAGIELVKALPSKVDDMPKTIIDFMASMDLKLLDPPVEDLGSDETPEDTEALEIIKRRVMTAQAMIASRKVGAKK